VKNDKKKIEGFRVGGYRGFIERRKEFREKRDER